MGILFDPSEVTALVLKRLQSDSAGSIVRDAFGVSSVSIIHARLMTQGSSSNGVPVKWTPPARPFCAFRRAPILSVDRTLSRLAFRIFMYDDANQGYWRLNKLIPLFVQALNSAPMLQPSSGGIIGTFETTDASDETVDPSLGLNLVFVTIGNVGD